MTQTVDDKHDSACVDAAQTVCAHNMNTIRFCFTTTVVFLVVAIGGRVASCEDDIVPIWKCCPLDRLYDPEFRLCEPAGTFVEEYRQQLVNRLEDGFRMASDATLNFTYHLPPYCNATEVLVNVPTEEMHELMEAHPSPYELPPDYCFDITPFDHELVARTCRPRDQYCGRVASCKEYNVSFRKCCPKGRPYDPEGQFCRPAGTDLEEYQQRFLKRLQHGFRVAAKAKLNMSYDRPPYCDAKKILVDVPAEEMYELMEEHSSIFELPLDYCFDLTRSDELVAQTCRPRDQYCGRPGYTCVNKCFCGAGYMLVYNPDKKNVTCENTEMPFKLSVYETDAGGSPVVLSNNTLLPIKGGPSCPFEFYNSFMLTTDGKLHIDMEDGKRIIPETEYCLEYYSEDGSQKDAHLTAHVCTNATPPPSGFTFWVILSASLVCLLLTLIVYATLPYLRNVHGYYVMFYMVCQLVYFICTMISWTIKQDLDSPLCIPFGYFYLFATLTTYCWLNVICFDIYWMLRYKNSTNRNTSKLVRTILYHIYCWGFSSIIVSTGYLFQHSQEEALQELLAPDIGKYRCEVYHYHSFGVFIFYFLPTCGTLTANFVLFILTTIHCSRIKSELNKLQQTDSKIQIFLFYKERVVMSIKLFMVFGIPFLLSILCRLFHNIEWITIWRIMKMIHHLQGVYIFIIFVAKPKVIMEIRKKFRRSTVQSELIQLNNTTGTS